MLWRSGRVAELADAKDLGSFGAILAGSTPVAPTNQIRPVKGVDEIIAVTAVPACRCGNQSVIHAPGFVQCSLGCDSPSYFSAVAYG